MAMIGEEQPASGGIPDLHGLIAACRGNFAPVGRPGYGQNPIGMSLVYEQTGSAQRRRLIHRGNIPDAHGIVLSAGDDLTTIGRPIDRHDLARMTDAASATDLGIDSPGDYAVILPGNRDDRIMRCPAQNIGSHRYRADSTPQTLPGIGIDEV